MHVRTGVLRCSDWSRRGMLLWKWLAVERQRPINTGRLTAECQRHGVGTWRKRTKCVVGVCPTVEMTVGFVPRYCRNKSTTKVKLVDLYSTSTRSVSKVLRYSTHCQGITQFYLLILRFICKRGEPYLPLPSQLQPQQTAILSH